MNEATPEKKPERPVPPTLANADKRSAAIAVKLLLFDAPRDYPGASAENKVKVDPIMPGRKRWTVDYIPSLRHFEITYYPSNEAEAVQRMYVHETHALSWYAA